RASPITAPSTQPPETEPTNLPSWSTASFAPMGRGDEPQVVTTVASATPLPWSFQSAACCRISSLSFMLLLLARARRRLHRAGGGPAGSARAPAHPGSRDYGPDGTRRHRAGSPACPGI